MTVLILTTRRRIIRWFNRALEQNEAKLRWYDADYMGI